MHRLAYKKQNPLADLNWFSGVTYTPYKKHQILVTNRGTK